MKLKETGLFLVEDADCISKYRFDPSHVNCPIIKKKDQ